jgi:TRAP-type C4-dicarboxylate transport system permease small subunit
VRARRTSVLQALANCFFTVMVAAVVIEVIARYVFHRPLLWTEEVAKLAFTWLAFLGAAIAARHNEHIQVETLVELFPRPIRHGLGILVRVAGVMFLIVVTVYSALFAISEIDSTSAAMEISKAWWVLPIPISTVLISMYMMRDLVTVIRGERERAQRG